MVTEIAQESQLRFFSPEQMKALASPIAEAEGLPGAAYASTEFFDLENRELWPKRWVAVAFTSDIPKPGSITTATVAGVPIFLARGQDGIVRSFVNICPHRANKLVVAPAQGKRVISCGWHCWTFDLKGQFVGAPRAKGEGSDAPAAEKPSLKSVRTSEWLGAIFVNLDGNARDLSEQTAALYEHYAAWKSLDELVPVAEVDQTWDANWKLWVEGGIEDYHLQFVHPQLLHDAEEFITKPHKLGEDFFGLLSKQKKRLDPNAEPLPQPLPEFPGMSPEARAAGGFFVMFPNFGMNIRATYIRTYLLTPEAPNRTRGRSQLLALPQARDDLQYQPIIERLTKLWTRVWDQDAPICAAVQKSAEIRDRMKSPTLFVAGWEDSVRNFQLKVVETINS